MSRRIRLQLNRVEGDLELDVLIKDGVVQDAWCIGSMYRGFEQIMQNRDPLDAIAITPRICGICSTAHLTASVMALENLSGITPAPNAQRIRNICLLAEEIQSDCRQTFLMFTPDLCHPLYADVNEYARIIELFKDMSGSLYRDAVVYSRKIIEIVAIFGGQWPHSSYMVPGGVTSIPDRSTILSALNLVDEYVYWFEKQLVGCPLGDWIEITSLTGLNDWVDKMNSPLATLIRFCQTIRLDTLGKSDCALMSMGGFKSPDSDDQPLLGSGVMDAVGGTKRRFDEQEITEDISHSWFHDPENRSRHPSEGLTIPKYDPDGDKYTWAKAPRYEGKPVQTGALAQLALSDDALINDWLSKEGSHALNRQFARIRRQAHSLLHLRQHILKLLDRISEPAIVSAQIADEGQGVGLTEVARGSLGHWLSVEQGKVSRYQVITPTAWNASPRDRNGQKGHMEQSLIGLPIQNPDEPVELGHVIRSNDPCLVCTVHVLGRNTTHSFGV